MRTNLQRALKEVRHLGVIGDVHARIDLLQRSSDALEAAGVDIIVCVGDIYGQREGSVECCKFLRDRGIQTVRGNHDRWFLDAAARDKDLRTSIGPDAIEFLSTLPITLTIPSVAGPVLVCHGVGSNDLSHIPQTFPNSFVRRAIRLGLIPADCKLLIHGHSHLQRQQHLGGIRFVTVGPLHSDPSAGCITIDSQNGFVSTVAY